MLAQTIGTKGLWSQQQKLISVDFMDYERNQDTQELDLTLGSRFLGPSMIINSEYEIAIGVTNKSPSSTSIASLFHLLAVRTNGRYCLLLCLI